jgi:hypothetical protein
MSKDEKNARRLAYRSFWLMAVPLVLSIAFICVRASSNGRWLCYSVFFLIFLARRFFIILLRIMSRLESELRNNAENDLARLSYFCAVIYNLVIELMILGLLNMCLFSLKVPLLGWDYFVLLFLIVLLQVGIRCFQQATECLYHVRRLHHAAYDRDNWIVYETSFAGHVKASTYCIPYGRDYQEVGIVLIEKREKEEYKEHYLSSGPSDFLFSPLFLVKSSCEVSLPMIQYDREQKSPLTLQFPDGGAVLVKHYSANRSFNRLVYFFKFRKVLQRLSGYRKSLLPRLAFYGFRPVLVPTK